MPRRALRLVLLGALSAFGPLSVDMYLPALPQLARDYGASASAAQLTLTAILAGLASGQLVAGPLSDRFGRRRPLLAGIALYATASLACAAAPSIAVLVALRFVQGAAGGAGIVVARAVVRDLYSGAALARVFSILMLVTGAAPVLAPLLGAQILRVSSWRGIFVVLAGIGAALFAASLALGETSDPARRTTGGFAGSTAVLRELVHDARFVRYVAVLGLGFGAMFAYIAGSPFVLQDVHHVSPQLYAVIFGANAAGIVALGQLNALLVGRFGAQRLLAVGVSISATGGVALLAVVAGGIGLAGIVPSLFLVVSSLGLILPNATALALAEHPHVAGSASGLIGVFQFVVGAAAAPLVGVAGRTSQYPMALVIATLALAGLVVLRTASHARRRVVYES